MAGLLPALGHRIESHGRNVEARDGGDPAAWQRQTAEELRQVWALLPRRVEGHLLPRLGEKTEDQDVEAVLRYKDDLAIRQCGTITPKVPGDGGVPE